MTKFGAMPRVKIKYRQDGRGYVEFSMKGRRCRYANGDVIGVDIKPNSKWIDNREIALTELKLAFHSALQNGWEPDQSPVRHQVEKLKTVLRRRLQEKISLGGYSAHYLRDLNAVVCRWGVYSQQFKLDALNLHEVKQQHLKDFIHHSSDGEAARRNLLRNLSALLRDEFFLNHVTDPFKGIRLSKKAQVLHKPYENVENILLDILKFDKRLFLCCLMTYGLLLRPHREIRCLKWSDFSDNLSTLALSGRRTKGKRNRQIPVNQSITNFITTEYPNRVPHFNIFTGTSKPYNPDFFKGLWTKYKRKSFLVGPDQTLYSFRHAGAIDVYKKTKSLETLRILMGHSSLLVTLTYLRGLKESEISQNDLPCLPTFLYKN